MYAKHQPIIGRHARQNADNMAAVLRFVVITIQNRLFNCPADCETITAVYTGQASDGEFEAANGILYGHKRAAVDYIDSERHNLYWLAESAFFHAETERQAAESLIAIFADIPGLGIVKAGFAAQLIYGVGGCLDSHNLERFGINPNKVKSSRYKGAKRLATKRAIISEYLDFCEQFGGCGGLWDSWCEYLATRPDETGVRMNGNKPLYESAYHVSALHCVSIGLCPETGKESGYV